MINTNELIKMKIDISSKPKLWKIPHFYICWCKNSNKNGFFVCTSNYFKLFASNICGTDEIVPIYNIETFKKETYLLLGENFEITNIDTNKTFFKKENILNQQQLNKCIEKGSKAKTLHINTYILL